MFMIEAVRKIWRSRGSSSVISSPLPQPAVDFKEIATELLMAEPLPRNYFQYLNEKARKLGGGLEVIQRRDGYEIRYNKHELMIKDQDKESACKKAVFALERFNDTVRYFSSTHTMTLVQRVQLDILFQIFSNQKILLSSPHFKKIVANLLEAIKPAADRMLARLWECREIQETFEYLSPLYANFGTETQGPAINLKNVLSIAEREAVMALLKAPHPREEEEKETSAKPIASSP